MFTDSNSSGDGPGLGNFQGRVNLDPVGGTGLNAVSVYSEPSRVGSDGRFATQVSVDGAQLLQSSATELLFDSNGRAGPTEL